MVAEYGIPHEAKIPKFLPKLIRLSLATNCVSATRKLGSLPLGQQQAS